MACKRYLPPALLERFFNQFDADVKSTVGYTVRNRPIDLLKIGSGDYQVLMWSQMHGNESTTTKALLDFIPWFLSEAQIKYQEAFTLHIIPQLNPDGSHLYTRANANGVDLNRDAIHLTQPESKVLRQVYESIKPDLCLNLHGQRTIYAAGTGGPSASLSFLAPAANEERSLTYARKEAMLLIAAITQGLSSVLQEAIGRYDDSFNPNCVGDAFTQYGTPTMLFEAGHIPGDYQREQTRAYIFQAYKLLFKQLLNPKPFELDDYLNLPQNTVEFCDLIVSGVRIFDNGTEKEDQQIAIQYLETLVNGEIAFLPQMLQYGHRLHLRAHKYLDLPTEIRSTPLVFNKESLIKDNKFTDQFLLKD